MDAPAAQRGRVWRSARGSCWRARRGETNTAVAAAARGRGADGAPWRGRFAERRLDGLLDEPRPGRPRKITDEQVEEVIVKTLESAPPDGGTHWSTRRWPPRSGLSQTAVSRIWRAFGLQPHRVEHFKLSTDPLFVEKVRDVVGLYLDPPERAIVLCVDEKTQIQALDRIAADPADAARHARRARPTTTSATAPPACSPPSTSPPAR